MRGARFALTLFVLLAAFACTTYEYEEEVFLDLSGSGRIRVSGSRGVLEALHGIEEPAIESARRHFGGDAVEVVSVRETRRRERSFLHVQMRFEDWNRLCQSLAFRERRCRLEVSDEEQTLELDSPRPWHGLSAEVDPAGVFALRFHLPSTVRYHNSPTGVERGNILSWERPVSEYFAGEPFSIEARYGRRSILSATLGVVLLAAGVVAALIVFAIYWMVKKGRRQLEAD